jgi:hypothetical protein
MQAPKGPKLREDLRHAIWGWLLFVVCALFFMAAAWRNRDVLTFVGSLVFLVACLFFLLPLARAARATEDDRE